MSSINNNVFNSFMFPTNKPANKDEEIIQKKPVTNPQNSSAILADYRQSMVKNPFLFIKQKNAANLAANNKPVEGAQKVSTDAQAKTTPWHNDLRKLFQKNDAVIYALVLRTFGANDKNGDGLIEKNKGEDSGTFLNAIPRLDELKKMGINTLHVLPVNPPGKKQALGTAGSIYAPSDFLSLDPKLADPNSKLTVDQQAKKFVDECHKRDIRVMIDLPSCASVDFYDKNPKLMAKDASGKPKIPQGWQDIRMFNPWTDEKNKVLNKPLLDMHKKFVDKCIDLGVDGIRVDVARAKPVEFWNDLIPYARKKDPNFAFLAESYVYEDASPMQNMPADRPEDYLKSGFDSFYGQYHIYDEWKTAKEFHDYVGSNLDMSKKLPADKSLIGSFMTHDDVSPMSHGGVPYCKQLIALESTLPMTNPYYLTGFESGDKYLYNYKDKDLAQTDTDSHIAEVHDEKLDIFNYSRRPGGDKPEIGDYLGKMSKVREQYNDVITKGSYIPLKVNGQTNDKIIAYARHYNGKTLVVMVNKDVNTTQKGQVIVPTLKANQQLKDLTPECGEKSSFKAKDNEINVELGAARAHVFEVDTKDIEKHVDKVYNQKLNV